MSNKKTIITDKDVLILKKLLEDGRASSSSISKEIDLGREIVNYRIKRLIKENLIVKFVPKVNEKALNYQEYIIFLKLNLEDEMSKDKFIKENIGNKYLVWTVKSSKGWDLIVRLYASSVNEFKLKLSEILEKFSDVLANYYTFISSEELKESEKEIIAKKVFDEDFSNDDFKILKNKEIISIDEKDKEILAILETDARIQYKEIADMVNVSSDTVKYRIDKMKEVGVIENISPIINLNKLGFNQYAGILKFRFLDKETEKKIDNFIIKNKIIVRAIKSLNSHEYFVSMLFDNDNDVTEFEEKIRRLSDKIESFEIFKID